MSLLDERVEAAARSLWSLQEEMREINSHFLFLRRPKPPWSLLPSLPRRKEDERQRLNAPPNGHKRSVTVLFHGFLS